MGSVELLPTLIHTHEKMQFKRTRYRGTIPHNWEPFLQACFKRADLLDWRVIRLPSGEAASVTVATEGEQAALSSLFPGMTWTVLTSTDPSTMAVVYVRQSTRSDLLLPALDRIGQVKEVKALPSSETSDLRPFSIADCFQRTHAWEDS